MINGLFKEISEEEMMSVNGGCGGGSPSPGNSKAVPGSKPTIAEIIVETMQAYVKYCSWKYYPECNGW
ncbi:MAG: bacteriocin [Treponema sp.]|nr:bacteriocin [Treponema sp.]